MKAIDAFLLISLILAGCLILQGQMAFADDSYIASSAWECLAKFAEDLASNAHSIRAGTHDLEAALLEKQRRRTAFDPKINVSEFSSKSANRSYNSLTGLEEDYTSRRSGTTMAISQYTPLGTAQIMGEKSDTRFSGTATMYFESLYFGMNLGLFRRDYKLLSLEKRQADSLYSIEQARIESILLDSLIEGLIALFDRVVAAQNVSFKEKNLTFYKTMVEEAKVKLENGLGSELDFKQAQMRLSIAETALEESVLALDDIDRRIGIITGSPDWDRNYANFEPGTLTEAIPFEFDIDDSYNRAVTFRPDIKLLKAQHLLQKQTLALAKEKSKPDIKASLSWGRQGRSMDSGVAADKPDKSWDVMLTWSTNIGRNPEKLDRNIENQRLKALSIRLNQSLESARQNLQSAIARIVFHRKNLSDLKQAADLSSEVLEGQKMNFQLGRTSLLDLTRYQSDFEEACLSVIRAEASLITAWLKFLYETGELAPKFNLKSSNAK